MQNLDDDTRSVISNFEYLDKVKNLQISKPRGIQGVCQETNFLQYLGIHKYVKQTDKEGPLINGRMLTTRVQSAFIREIFKNNDFTPKQYPLETLQPTLTNENYKEYIHIPPNTVITKYVNGEGGMQLLIRIFDALFYGLFDRHKWNSINEYEIDLDETPYYCDDKFVFTNMISSIMGVTGYDKEGLIASIFKSVCNTTYKNNKQLFQNRYNVPEETEYMHNMIVGYFKHMGLYNSIYNNSLDKQTFNKDNNQIEILLYNPETEKASQQKQSVDDFLETLKIRMEIFINKRHTYLNDLLKYVKNDITIQYNDDYKKQQRDNDKTPIINNAMNNNYKNELEEFKTFLENTFIKNIQAELETLKELQTSLTTDNIKNEIIKLIDKINKAKKINDEKKHISMQNIISSILNKPNIHTRRLGLSSPKNLEDMYIRETHKI